MESVGGLNAKRRDRGREYDADPSFRGEKERKREKRERLRRKEGREERR